MQEGKIRTIISDTAFQIEAAVVSRERQGLFFCFFFSPSFFSFFLSFPHPRSTIPSLFPEHRGGSSYSVTRIPGSLPWYNVIRLSKLDAGIPRSS